MKNETIIHNLPDGMTLTDLCLDGVKVGDEVVTLQRADNGGASIGSRVFRVRTIEDWRVLVDREDGKTHGAWRTKNGGGCSWMMHPENVMRYYYSANPSHIAAARRNAREEKAAEERKKAAFEAKMQIARPIGEELGDGWDSEEGYKRETAAQTLAEKLTPEQMRTLAGWLGVGAIPSAESGQASGESVRVAHVEELRRQNAALLEQVTELSALVREIPGKLTQARLDGKQGKPTSYDYARAGRALAVRV